MSRRENAWHQRQRPSIERAREKYAHGTRPRYVFGKCRCVPCRAADSRYKTECSAEVRKPYRCRHVYGGRWLVIKIATGEEVFRSFVRAEAEARRDDLNRKEGPAPPARQLVSTREVVAHIKKLRAAGVGIRGIWLASRVRRDTLRRILSGDIRKTRRSTAQRILAVTVAAVQPRAYVDASPIWTLLDRLIALGYKKRWIARNLGNPRARALQIKRGRCTAKNARAVVALYRKLFESDERLRKSEPPSRLRELLVEKRLERVLNAMPNEQIAAGIERIFAA